MVTRISQLIICQLLLIYEIFTVIGTIDLFSLNLTDPQLQERRVKNYVNFRYLTGFIDFLLLAMIFIFRLAQEEYFAGLRNIFFILAILFPSLLVYIGQIWLGKQIKNQVPKYDIVLLKLNGLDFIRGEIIVLLGYIVIQNYALIFRFSSFYGFGLFIGSISVFIWVFLRSKRIISPISRLFIK